MSGKDFAYIEGYTPGIIGRITRLHAEYYAGRWGFGSFFEVKVAAELAQFVWSYSAAHDRIWSVVQDGTIEGSIAVDGTSEQNTRAHLRWFIVSGKLRGKGAGNGLLEKSLSFSRAAGYPLVYLWTFEGLDAARHLYEKYGFKLVEEHIGKQWGTAVKEQRFELRLTRDS